MKGDTISRQAALEAMETWDKFGCDPDGKLVKYDDNKHIPYVHYEDMVYTIKHLPSTQSEDYTELKQEFFRMVSYIDVLLECSDAQKETLIGFISRLAKFMPWKGEQE